MTVQPPLLEDEEELEPNGNLLSFKEEMRQMPSMQRWTIYASIFCLGMLAVQCLLVMPVILIKYGWGYSVN